MGKGRSDGKIFTFSITLEGGRHGDFCSTFQAETAAKAKYQHYKQYDEFFEDYAHYLSYKPKVKKIGEFKPSDLFPKQDIYFNETWEQIKKYRYIPFIELGMKVEVDGTPGVIVGYHGLNLLVCLQGYTFGSNCHPHYKVKYFDKEGNLIKEFGD